MVSHRPMISWTICSTNRSLFFWRENTWAHVLTQISEKTDFNNSTELCNQTKFLICTNWSYFSKACFSLTWYIDFPAWADLDWTFWAPDSNSVGIFSCQKLCMVDLDLRLRWVILGCHCWPHFLRWCFLPTQLRPWEKIAIYYIKNPFSQSQKNGQHDLKICPKCT